MDIEVSNMSKTIKMAVLGPKGTFSDRAYIEYNKYYKENINSEEVLDPVYCSSIDEVFEQVCPDEGEPMCELGIVPIENTLDGYVLRTLDLLHEKDTWIMDENLVEVQFSLVGNVASVDEIKKLYVQFKANGQCRKFINSLSNVEIITTESNMDSYYKIENNAGEAAIVPCHIAKEDDRFTVDHVTDADVNFTRFIVFRKAHIHADPVARLKRRLEESGFDDNQKIKIPVYIMPKIDRPGILFEILREFYENQINLISIMSRPTKQEMGTYNFYMDIDGIHGKREDILRALANIQGFNDIKVLGAYVE